MTPEARAGIREAVLGWYDDRGRSLPFRGTTDPYAVLVSEVMAQQTQISRVGPAWSTFMTTFPTIAALAAAAPADVLRAWQGMGYNRRGLNLWRCARVVVEEHGGVLPSEVAALERLPCIGPYTARAVAAIAFGRPVGAVDTNVRRVLGRAIGGAADAFPARRLQDVADAVVPPDRPADWTHAVMDIGAMFCRPARPRSEECPLKALCRFALDGTSSEDRSSAARVRRPAGPFDATSRWLRGRILDRLRAAPDERWVEFDGPIGTHEPAAVATAVARLAEEGLLELRAPALPAGVHARLPVA